MSTAVAHLIEAEGLPADYRAVVDSHWRPLSEDIAERYYDKPGRPLIVGINGAQGSGKSTVAKFLEVLLVEHNLRGVIVSLDDLYLTHDERLAAAENEHPLFATRGVPGTHDIVLGEKILDALQAGRPATLPRFDKASDDRSLETTLIDHPVEVILLEGWCVGAVAQGLASLREPINALERDEDPAGVWRGYINEQLDGSYQALFGKLHDLILLQAPSFEVVHGWRIEQEHKLRDRAGGGMSDEEIARFIAHYERLTRWILAEMPGRADWVVPLDENRTPFT